MSYNKFFRPSIELIRECRGNAADVHYFMNRGGLISCVPPGFLSVQKNRDLRELVYIPMTSAIDENIEREPKGLCVRNFRMDEDIDYTIWDRGTVEEYRICTSPRGEARLDRKDVLIYGFGVFNDTKPDSLTVDVTHDEREDFYQSHTASWGYGFSMYNNYFHELEPMIHLSRHINYTNFRFKFPMYVEDMNVKLYGIVAESLGNHVAG